MDFINELKQRYSQGALHIKFIFINVALFLIIRIIDVMCLLFGFNFSPAPYLELPSNLQLLLYRPYTIITYMFFQYDILHLLFNMLWLYWFGALFLQFFNTRQLGGLYILGGLSGAILYLASYNLLPYFSNIDGMLLGASASVLAIVFATSAYAPNYKIRLFLIGELSLKYLALIVILIDIISVTSQNAGGHIAHIGGALLGWWFASRWRQGKDITRGINSFIDRITLLFRRSKPQVKWRSTRHRRPMNDAEYNRQRHNTTVEIDRILDKIKQSGYNALTAEEKKKLFDAGKK